MPMIRMKVRGALGKDWSEWFGGLRLSHDENGDTLVVGQVDDDAAVYGMIARVRDLGMGLLRVEVEE